MPKFKGGQEILAHLVKHRKADMPVAVWYWVNPMTGVKISAEFATKEEASRWFDDLVNIHNDTYDLLARSKDGEMYELKGIVEESGIYNRQKTKDCPFKFSISNCVLTISVLGMSKGDAKQRVEDYFDILSWIE